MDTDGGQGSTEEATPTSQTPLTPEEQRVQDQRQKLRSIMRGETSVQLYLEFLHSHNHADLQVRSRDWIEILSCKIGSPATSTRLLSDRMRDNTVSKGLCCSLVLLCLSDIAIHMTSPWIESSCLLAMNGLATSISHIVSD